MIIESPAAAGFFVLVVVDLRNFAAYFSRNKNIFE
jgi:hypothetical protein